MLYRGASFDRLVHPGGPIPPASTAVHGITDGMVADADGFGDVWPPLLVLARDTVWVGHNIRFDAAILRAECARAGVAFPEPILLDTLKLSTMLEPSLETLSLDGVAAWLGVDVHGRHTALGDALVTAEVWRRLIPRLEDAGIVRFGDALELQARATHLDRQQDAAGW